jgi:hypothetical protein
VPGDAPGDAAARRHLSMACLEKAGLARIAAPGVFLSDGAARRGAPCGS